jgi:hypothetical protein
MGDKGIERVMEKYSYQRLVRDMTAYYYELLERKIK